MEGPRIPTCLQPLRRGSKGPQELSRCGLASPLSAAWVGSMRQRCLETDEQAALGGDQPARPSGERSLDWRTGFAVAAADSLPVHDAFVLDASHGLRATVSAAAGDALGLGTADDPPNIPADDMSSPQPTASPDERRSPDTDSAGAPGSVSEPGTGAASWRRNASWLVPCMIALLVYLFGDNVTGRFGPADAPGDGPGGDPAAGEDRFHATYSFRTPPFVHPKIVGDLVGSLADAGDQVVAINLLDSQDSNRYYGEIFVMPQTESRRSA